MKTLTFTATAILLGSLAVSAGAQDFEDEPGPGVARLSLIAGDVTVQRGDSGEFVAAERNAPLVALDHVFTGDNARAEIQLDWANMIRLSDNSEVRLAALEQDDFFLQLVAGTATFSVLRDSSALVEISTPAASLRPLAEGAYRIMVRPDGSTEISVRTGEADIFTASQTERLVSGRTVEVSGDPNAPQILLLANLPRDEWDRWNEARDTDLRQSDSYRYVSRDIRGADDLAGHGRWVYDSPYGWVWVPTVSQGWAPYRVGRWTWVDYYGWTWVSGDPWGWAPYHYGRWYYASRYGWVWYPGGVGVRQYWRPALVSFFGWGSGGFRVNVGISFGYRNVGWVPLAPYEVYRPWYGRGSRTNVAVNNTRISNTTINNTTIINDVDIVNTYVNARQNNGRRSAVTSVSADSFGRGRVTDNNYVRVSDSDLNRAGEVRGRVPFEPTTESRRFADRAVDTRQVPRNTVEDRLLARRTGRDETNETTLATTTGPAPNAPRPNAGNRGGGNARQAAAAPEVSANPAEATASPRRTGPAANAPRPGATITNRSDEAPAANGNGNGQSRGAVTAAPAPSAPRRAAPARNEAPAVAAQPEAPARRVNSNRGSENSARQAETTPAPAPERRVETLAPSRARQNASPAPAPGRAPAQEARTAPEPRRAPEPAPTPSPSSNNGGGRRAAPAPAAPTAPSRGNSPATRSDTPPAPAPAQNAPRSNAGQGNSRPNSSGNRAPASNAPSTSDEDSPSRGRGGQ